MGIQEKNAFKGFCRERKKSTHKKNKDDAKGQKRR